MEQRRFTLFMVLAIIIFIGWMYLQYVLWPPKPQISSKIPKSVTLVACRVPVGGGPLVEAGRLAWDFERLQPSGPRKAPEPKTPSQKPPREIALAYRATNPIAWLLIPTTPAPPSPASLGSVALLADFVPKKEAAPDAIKTYPLGDGDSYIQAVLTTRGAGIRQLTLNRFEAANWLGEPAHEVLELIPEDSEIASFLMYHFPDAKKTDALPVLTLGEKNWKCISHNKDEVVFTTTLAEEGLDHIRITKTYRLGPKDYHIELIVEFKNEREDGNSVPLRYQLTGAHGLPIEGEWYTNVYRNAVIGMVDGRNNLWRTLEDSMRISSRSGGDRVPPEGGDRGESYLEYAGVTTQYFASLIVVDNEQPSKRAGGVNRQNILAWARPTLESTEKRGRLLSVNKNRLVIAEGEKGEKSVIYFALPRVLSHIKESGMAEGAEVVVNFYVNPDNGHHVATWIRRATVLRPYLDDITVRVNSEYIELKPKQPIAHQFMLYNGPVKTALLGQFRGDKAVDPELVERYTHTLHLNTLTDYGRFGFWTDLLITCTRLMHWLLNLLHMVVPNYGLSIILLTVIVRGAMFPISRKQAYFSVKMQELAPEMKKIQEKFKNDARGRTEATMELYRKHKVHPLGSCLPLLMQMPIFLGLYYALQESIHFRLARFFWMPNLAAPDMFVYWGESIPVISDPDNTGSLLSVFYLGPFLNLLPIFAVTLMIIQQKLMTPPPVDEQQAMQQKMMKYMMVLFGVLFYKVAAGLCIYFITSSLWGLAERKMLPKKKVGEAPVPVPSTAVKPGLPPVKGKGPKGKGPPKKEEKPDGRFQKVKDWWQDVLKKASKK